jgi:hypothetical protein
VSIFDSTVKGDVRGGFIDPVGGSATATHNTVTLSGNTNVVENVYGGDVDGVTTITDIFSGNTLNIWNPKSNGISVGKDVDNFEFFNFTFQPEAPINTVGLDVTGTAFLNDGSSRPSVIQSVNSLGGGTPLPVGQKFTLIKAGALNTTYFTQNAASGKHGATLLYSWDIATTGNSVESVLTNISVHPQAKALSEGQAGGLAFVNQGQDLLAGQGIRRAVSSAAATNGPAAFSAFSGGKSRYDTGSHVDVNGVSLLAGLAWGADIAPGRLTLGAFVEGGTGNYDSHNSFNGLSSVKGDGDTNYLGGGVLGRFDLNSTDSGHFYAEASARLGKLKNDFSSGLSDGVGTKAKYDTDSRYYGLHLGSGYVWNIDDKTSLDLYAKYFWTRQEGDNVTLSTGDPVSFKAADSHRTRVGARFAYAVNEYLTPYVGAAWEREFDGKAKATTYGYSIPAPDLKGDTGMAELGLTLTKPGNAISLDLGIQGYTGMRQGVSGSLRMAFEF